MIIKKFLAASIILATVALPSVSRADKFINLSGVAPDVNLTYIDVDAKTGKKISQKLKLTHGSLNNRYGFHISADNKYKIDCNELIHYDNGSTIYLGSSLLKQGERAATGGCWVYIYADQIYDWEYMANNAGVYTWHEFGGITRMGMALSRSNKAVIKLRPFTPQAYFVIYSSAGTGWGNGGIHSRQITGNATDIDIPDIRMTFEQYSTVVQTGIAVPIAKTKK